MVRMNHSLVKTEPIDRAGEVLRALNATLEILPVVINIVLDLFEDVLVAGLEEVLETTLGLQEVRDRNKVLLANRGKLPHAILDLEQRPELGVHC